MECIILAGSGESYREVRESENKAFLKVKGRSILQWILRQLQDVPRIASIHVVGPKQRLEEHLKEIEYPATGIPVTCYEESQDIVSNIYSVHDSLGSDPNKVYMIMPSDVPLITAGEINQFLDRCDAEAFDLQTGMTTAAALARFAPTESQPGVQMATFAFRGVRLRVNNLHLVRPGGVRHGQYIRKIYALRYQKRIRNALGLVAVLFPQAIRLPAAIWYFVCIHMARVTEVRGHMRLAKWLANRIHVNRGERMISKIIGARFRLVITDIGGSAIDVDNDADYQAMQQRFDEWYEMQQRLASDSGGN